MESKNKFLIFLILLAVASGLFWGFSFSKVPEFEVSGSGEALGYDQAARKILKEGIGSSYFRQSISSDRPLYPIFLAGIYKIFGRNHTVVTFVQVLLFILIVVLVYKIGQMIFSEKIARWSAALTAFCYSIASFAGLVFREVLFTFLVVLMIYVLYKAYIRFKKSWFFAAGAIGGLAFLTNAIVQLFFLAALVNFFIVCRQHGFGKILPRTLLFLLGLGLILWPWMAGGYLSFGGAGLEGLLLRQRVEKMEAIEGKYLQHFVGNALGDFFAYKWFPGYNPREVRHGIETWEKYGQWVDEDKDLTELNKIFLAEAKDKIWRPWLFLQQTSIDFLKFNTPMTPNVHMQSMFVGTHPELPDWLKAAIIIFIRLVYFVFFILILYAILKTLRHWSKISWLFLIILYFNGAFSLINAIARNSVPIYPFYIMFFMVGSFMIYNKIKHQNENLFSNQ